MTEYTEMPSVNLSVCVWNSVVWTQVTEMVAPITWNTISEFNQGPEF